MIMSAARNETNSVIIWGVLSIINFQLVIGYVIIEKINSHE